MGVEVHATGVLLRLAADHEIRAVDAARRRGTFTLSPSRNYQFTWPSGPLANGEVLVVSEAFVELTHDGAFDRWRSFEHHGIAMPTRRDATLELLALARETAEDLIELLADLRISGVGVARWELFSAPHRFELEPALRERLAPLRRG